MYPRFGELTWITPYGLALVTACALCLWLTRRRARLAGWDVSHVDFALPLAFVVGALGARLLAILFFDRLLLFALLLAAIPVLWIYCRRAGLSFLQFGDLLAPPLLLWLAVLRIGCFCAGCCWGDVVAADSVLGLIGVTFPPGSLAALHHAELGLIPSSVSESLPVLPTQLIESVALVGLYGVLTRTEHTARAHGTVLFATLTAYAGLRFFVEFIRADNAVVLGPLTGNQLVCAALFGAGAWWLFVRRRIRP